MTDEELEELEIFLEDEENNTIYEELTNTNYSGLFDPLEFFRLFQAQLDFIENHKSSPSFLIEKLNNLELNTIQKIVFFEYLLSDLQVKSDRQSRICYRQLEKLTEELKKENEEAEKAEQNIELQRILDHLETLPNNREKIAYVREAKTQYENTKTTLIEVSERTFSKSCELIITKLKQLQNIEISNSKKQKNIMAQENLSERQKDKDLTLDRAVLIFSYLLNYSKANAHNTEKAEFISFLTGFSKNTIVQKLSRLHEKADLNFVGYEKDMKIVRRFFEKLNLTEITKAIDNDLEA